MAIGDGVVSPNQARHDYAARGVTVGFLTDPTVCIGCKACEVACKAWNGVPDAMTVDGGPRPWRGWSYDHTGALGASSWRHVKFRERDGALRWQFLSDVCKHCAHAGCLEACPTGSIIRTEIGSVYVQDDVCNGCGYCVVSCPFGVIDRRPAPQPGAGGAFKCTLCYDRQLSGRTPACAKVCPTESIRFGPVEELRAAAEDRVATLRARGQTDIAVYDPQETSVAGIHALFLVPGDPADFGLPPRPEAPTVHLRAAWTAALAAMVLALVIVTTAVAVGNGPLWP